MISHQQPLKKWKERHFETRIFKVLSVVVLLMHWLDFICISWTSLKEETVYTQIKSEKFKKLIYLSERN